MELRQLRYFLSVARTQNFTRAAAELHIAQPPLSRQIAQLEEELGTILIDRDARPLRLTPAGELFRDHAVEVLARIQRMGEETRQLGRTGQRTFRIGMEAFTFYGRFPGMIRSLRAADPRLRIDIRELAAAEQATALKAGEIDIGLANLKILDPEIEQVTVREEALSVALPVDHALAKDGIEPVGLQDLVDETFVLFPAKTGPKATHPIQSFLAQRAFRPKDVIETAELQVALGLVAGGVGVCIVPAVARQIRPDEICYRPLAGPGAASPIILSYSREHPPAVLPLVLKQIGRSGGAEAEPNGDGSSDRTAAAPIRS